MNKVEILQEAITCIDDIYQKAGLGKKNYNYYLATI